MKQEIVEKYRVPYDISKVTIANIPYQTKDLAAKVGYVNADKIVTDGTLQDVVTNGYPQAITFGDAQYVMLYLLQTGRAEVVVDDGGHFDHWVVHPIPTVKAAHKTR